LYIYYIETTSTSLSIIVYVTDNLILQQTTRSLFLRHADVTLTRAPQQGYERTSCLRDVLGS